MCENDQDRDMFCYRRIPISVVRFDRTTERIPLIRELKLLQKLEWKQSFTLAKNIPEHV